MRFIRPTPLTSAMLTSSTVPETDYAAWNAATSYILGDRVIRTQTHRIYENVIAGVNATTPESAPTRWVDVAPTNTWAMFDGQVGTATSATDTMTVVLTPGRFNGLALLQVDASNAEITLTAGGEIVFHADLNLYSGNTISNWYQYFYEPIYTQESVVLTDLVDAAMLEIPSFSEGVLTVTITRADGGTVSCGMLVVGLYTDLGETQYQPTIGIIDYSKKEVDVFGNPTIIQRKYSKRMSAESLIYREDVDQVSRVLAQYRSTAVVWVGAGDIYSSMIIYGFYKDWSITIENYSQSMLSLEVEGMI